MISRTFKELEFYTDKARVFVTNGYIELQEDKPCYVVLEISPKNFKELITCNVDFEWQDGGYWINVPYDKICCIRGQHEDFNSLIEKYSNC